MQRLEVSGVVRLVYKSLGRLHTGFLPESDPAPVVEFFTRTGITAAGGGFHTD